MDRRRRNDFQLLKRRRPQNGHRPREIEVSTLKKFGSLIGGAAAVAASIGLSAGLAPASAAPQASPGVTLDVHGLDPANPANWRLRIEGTFPMSEGDAHDRVSHMTPSGGMDYIIYADDPGENDAMIGSPHGYIGMPGPDGGFMTASPFGIRFLREISVPKSQLDEDDGFDEVYVKVRFVPGNGMGDLVAYTDVYDGEYGD
jgi:hypothetical protein